MPIFTCDNCEDDEWFDGDMTGLHCDCGGHLFIKRKDYYVEVEYIEPCITCRNRSSELCSKCSRGY